MADDTPFFPESLIQKDNCNLYIYLHVSSICSLDETAHLLEMLQEKKRKVPPDGHADGDRQAPLVGGRDNHTLYLGLTHMEAGTSHLTMGIREELQTDKQVVGQSRPVEPSDLQSAVDKGAFDALASNPAGLSQKDNLA